MLIPIEATPLALQGRDEESDMFLFLSHLNVGDFLSTKNSGDFFPSPMKSVNFGKFFKQAVLSHLHQVNSIQFLTEVK